MEIEIVIVIPSPSPMLVPCLPTLGNKKVFIEYVLLLGLELSTLTSSLLLWGSILNIFEIVNATRHSLLITRKRILAV